jgi:hypothetical protein
MTTTAAEQLGLDPLDVDGPAEQDLTLWSVTTILGVLDKPALLYWSAEMTANAAIDSPSTWRAMLEEQGRGEAVKWLRDARFRRPKTLLSATDTGTVVHDCCEAYALTGQRPSKDDVANRIRAAGGDNVDIEAETRLVGHMINQFDGWLQRFSPSYQATEVCVYSPTYGYAGTADGFLTVDGFRAIIDYKTSREPVDSKGRPKTPYADQVGLQLAAYRWAEAAAVWRPRRMEKFRRRYYLLSESERALAVPVPEVDGGLCIHITPEACEAYPIRCDEEAHRAFLYTLECFRWVNETARTAMGQPLEPAP